MNKLVIYIKNYQVKKNQYSSPFVVKKLKFSINKLSLNP